jgi:hypothetical protein
MTDGLLTAWRAANLSSGLVEKARSLVGQSFSSSTLYYSALRNLLTTAERNELAGASNAYPHLEGGWPLSIGPVKAFSAIGWLGQYGTFVPASGVVGVRMRVARPADYDGGPEIDGFPDFEELLVKLVPSP